MCGLALFAGYTLAVSAIAVAMFMRFSDVLTVFSDIYTCLLWRLHLPFFAFQYRLICVSSYICISVTLHLHFSDTHTCNCWCLHVNFGDGYSHGWRGELLHVRPCSSIAMGDSYWRQAGTWQKGWQVFSSYFLPSVAPSLLLKPKKRVMTRRTKRTMAISCLCHFTAKENVR